MIFIDTVVDTKFVLKRSFEFSCINALLTHYNCVVNMLITH